MRCALRIPLLVLAVACADAAEPAGGADRTGPRPITVLAAASLTEVLPALHARWAEVDPDRAAPATFSFDSTPRLAAQIAAGAPADLVVAADREWIDELARRGHVEPASRVDLAGNELVLVVRAEAGAAAPRDAAALAAAPPERLALAGETVPAGRYADAALGSLGIAAPLAPRIVRGDSVRSALAYVARGEADAAVVYRTDARAEPRVRIAFAFPAGSHPPIVHPAAVVRRTGVAAAEARAFLAFCATPAAHEVLARHGFTLPAAVRP